MCSFDPAPYPKAFRTSYVLKTKIFSRILALIILFLKSKTAKFMNKVVVRLGDLQTMGKTYPTTIRYGNTSQKHRFSARSDEKNLKTNFFLKFFINFASY